MHKKQASFPNYPTARTKPHLEQKLKQQLEDFGKPTETLLEEDPLEGTVMAVESSAIANLIVPISYEVKMLNVCVIYDPLFIFFVIVHDWEDYCGV